MNAKISAEITECTEETSQVELLVCGNGKRILQCWKHLSLGVAQELGIPPAMLSLLLSVETGKQATPTAGESVRLDLSRPHKPDGGEERSHHEKRPL